MYKVIKKTGAILIILSLFLSLCACEGKLSNAIIGLSVEDISDQIFEINKKSEDFKVNVINRNDYEASDVNVVITDASIIKIDFEKQEPDYLSYNITGLKEGTTSFYFETADHLVKSDEIEITVRSNIESISFNDTSDIVLGQDDDNEIREFNAGTDGDISDDIFEFVSENPEVATIGFEKTNQCIIKGVNSGKTYVYIKTKDGLVQSEKLKVIVESEAEQTYKATDSEDTSDDATIDNSRTVYITPTGKKYHYRKTCAGKNAIEKTLDTVKDSYGPCKKCAQ